jgi:hypothetical protein
MAFLDLKKLSTTRIYKLEFLLLKASEFKDKKEIQLLMAEDPGLESFVSLSNTLKFQPNSPRKIYFPDYKINIPSLSTVHNTNIRDERFNELKSFKLPFNKILDLGKVGDAYASKPVIADASNIRDAFNRYCIIGKRRPSAAIGVFINLLEHAAKLVPSGFTPNLYIELSRVSDPFLEAMLYSIRSRTKDVFKIFANLGVVFVASNGFVFKPDFSKEAEKTRILTLLSKTVALATNPNEELDSSIEVVSDESVSAEDKVAFAQTSELVVDSTDKEQIDISPELAHVDEKSDTPVALSDKNPGEVTAETVPSESEDKSNTEEDDQKTTEVPSENAPDEPDEPDEVVPPEALSLDSLSIMGIGATDLDKIKAENKAFLDKNLPKQVNAISELEKEADKLAADKDLDVLNIKDTAIMSENVKNTNLTSLSTSYYKKQFKRDMLNSFKSLNNDPEFPVVITKYNTTNNSTALTKTDQLTVEFLDKKFKRHTFTVDVPKLSHDGFMMINGSKKFIAKQATPVPVIKETHDRVQITTNYRKTFLYRKGEKTSGQLDRILRVIEKGSYESIEKVYGNSVAGNINCKVSIPYTYLAKKYYRLTINGRNGVQFLFNQEKIREELKASGFEPDYNKFIPIGYILNNGKPFKVILEDIESRGIYSASKSEKPQKLADSMTHYMTDIVRSTKDPDLAEAYKVTKNSMKLSYTEIKIVSTSMALGCLIAAYRGLLPALDLYKVKYSIEDRRRAKTESEVILAFKDMYLYIDTEFKPDKEIFINGLLFLNTSLHSIEDTGPFSTIFLDYLEEATGSRNTAKALSNFESSMLDPITMETLISYKMPTNFPELLLYGNSLLGSLERNRKNDMTHFRIRDSEVITVAVYNVLMEAFNNYKRSMRSGVVQPISTKKDAVLKALQGMTNVEGYSTLNPFLEAELKSKTTFKGPSGLTHY